MSLILPILIFAIFYFLIIRPKQAKLKAAQAEQQRITEGDRVLTRSGIYGRVNRISQDLTVVEVAPGIELVFDRRSVVKAPESVDVESQLSEESLSPEFSDEDFSQLHEHLESHVGDTAPSEVDLDGHATSGAPVDDVGAANADDDELRQPGDDEQH